MDYVTKTAEDIIDFHRRALLQYEDDHLRHTLNADAAAYLLDNLPAPILHNKNADTRRANLIAQHEQLTEQASSAEALALTARAALDKAGADYLAPVESAAPDTET